MRCNKDDFIGILENYIFDEFIYTIGDILPIKINFLEKSRVNNFVWFTFKEAQVIYLHTDNDINLLSLITYISRNI